MTVGPGVRLGRYELRHRLGKGGHGEVWAALLHGPMGFRRPVALKVLPAVAAASADREGLMQEARLGALVSHPNVVSTLELGEQDGRWFMAMDLVAGLTADQLRRKGPLPAAALVDLGVQTCHGLAYIHQLCDLAIACFHGLVRSGPYELSERQLRRAFATGHRNQAVRTRLGHMVVNLGDAPAAEALVRAGLEGASGAELGRTQLALGMIVRRIGGRQRECIELFGAAAMGLRRVGNRYHLTALGELGIELAVAGRVEEGVFSLEQTLAQGGAATPDGGYHRGSLAGVLGFLGRFDEADRHFRLALEELGADNLRHASSTAANHAELLRHIGALDDALSQGLRAGDAGRRSLQWSAGASGMAVAGEAAARLGDPDQGEAWVQEGLRMLAYAPQDNTRCELLTSLAVVEHARGRPCGALLEEAVFLPGWVFDQFRAYASMLLACWGPVDRIDEALARWADQAPFTALGRAQVVVAAAWAAQRRGHALDPELARALASVPELVPSPRAPLRQALEGLSPPASRPAPG